MDRLQLFNNLMVLAASDGKFTSEEITLLCVRAAEWGISNGDIQAAVANAGETDVDIILPDDDAERAETLREMIRLMAIDGQLAEIEKRLCATASVAMGYSTHDFNQILDSVLADAD